MNSLDFITQSQTATLSNALEAVIDRECIIDFGIIKKVLAKGVVQVLISSATDREDIRVINCELLSPSASSIMIDIVPQVDDKVLVISPRRYSPDMFQKEKNEVIIDENSKGYSPFKAMAILCNQYRTEDYKNVLTLDSGNITYTSSDEDGNVLNNLSLSINGTISVSTKSDKDTPVVTFTANSNGVSLKDAKENEINTSDKKIELKVKDGCTAVLDNEKAVIGKLTIKK